MIYATEAEAALLDRAMPSWRSLDDDATVEPVLLAIRALLDGAGAGAQIGAPPVHVALARAKAKIAAVAKERTADAPGARYNFRGIDQILGAVHAAHAEEGIVIVPHDLEIERKPWDGEGWRGFFFCRIHLLWQIIGPAGDSLFTQSWGEAMDNADKGLGKARSYAQKDLLIRLHEIPTDDPDVGDTEATRDTSAGQEDHSRSAIELAKPEEIAAIIEVLRPLLEASGGDYSDAWRSRRAGEQPGTYRIETLESMAAGDRPCAPAEAIDVMHEALAEWKAAIALEALSEPAAAIDPESSAAAEAQAFIDAAQAAEPEAEKAADHAPANGEPEACEICGSKRAQLAEVDGIWRCRNAHDCAKRAAEKAAAEVVGDPTEENLGPCPACGLPIDPAAAAVELDGELFHELCAGDVRPEE